MANQTLTAFYDSRSEAETALEQLVSAGVPRHDVRIVAGGGTSSSTDETQSDSNEDSGFFAALKDLFLPDEDRYSYAEGLRRGGVMLTASVDNAHVDRAADILEQHGAVDFDERESSWRSEGWTGYTGASTTTGEAMGGTSDTGYLSGSEAMGSSSGSGFSPGLASEAGAVGGAARAAGDALTGTSTTSGDYRSTATTGSALGAMGSTGSGAASTARTEATGDEAIPILEEELRVGKRQVEGGRVKVRSYVVETPVQEQVTLRQEHVGVERVAVDRPVSSADALFQERTIEATASSEEATVSKEARVTEELRIHKDVEQTTQTVSDTVRRTEVEVDDERTDTATQRTGTDTSRNS